MPLIRVGSRPQAISSRCFLAAFSLWLYVSAVPMLGNAPRRIEPRANRA